MIPIKSHQYLKGPISDVHPIDPVNQNYSNSIHESHLKYPSSPNLYLKQSPERPCHSVDTIVPNLTVYAEGNLSFNKLYANQVF